MTLALPPRLLESARASAEGTAWLARLPRELERLAQRWSLEFEAEPGGAGATCSYVAFVRRTDGTKAVLKLGLPHMEAEQEALGLRAWGSDPASPIVRLLAEDEASGALLIERCDPGTPLSLQPEPEQDDVIAGLLRRLWRAPAPGQAFRPLSEMVRYWADIALARPHEWPDPGWVRAGVSRLLELGQPGADDALLATDLHAGNVLAASREPWLAIDPKPFFGDRSYDATQHLSNCTSRLCADPSGTVTRFCQLLNVKHERVHAWLFARFAAHTRRGRLTFGLSDRDAVSLARRLEKLAD
ncbi:MAG TPA: aminoglycoside phosphotransferase family protein [Polyangiaceae bacterium]|nr:aminoglycoside phosphotransferase family protein [Polyangiaceae bacterium]